MTKEDAITICNEVARLFKRHGVKTQEEILNLIDLMFITAVAVSPEDALDYALSAFEGEGEEGKGK